MRNRPLVSYCPRCHAKPNRLALVVPCAKHGALWDEEARRILRDLRETEQEERKAMEARG